MKPKKNPQPDNALRERGAFPSTAGKGIWLPALLLIAATLAAYWPVLNAGFIWDDTTFLLANPLIKNSGGLYDLWFATRTPDYFPMTSTSLWLEWRLWGANATGYHLTNLALHALSAVLCWRVLERLKIPGAWLAAAIFAVHPVNVESVAWITERKNTLAMFFYVWTLLLFLWFEDTGLRRWYGLSAVAFVLALLSKTAVVPLPFVLLGVAWWRRGRIERRDVWRSSLFFAMAAVLGLITVWFQYHKAIREEIVRDDNFWSRLAIAGKAVWFYLYKAVIPLDLVYVYPRWPTGETSGRAFIPALLVVLALLAGWYFRRRVWVRALLAGFGYFVLLLLPVLGFLNIYFMKYSLVADHYQYFSIIGPIALVATAITLALRKVGNSMAFLRPVVCGTVLLALGVLTWRQCGTYADNKTIWRATIAGNPDCVIAHNNLGTEFLAAGEYAEALRQFQDVLKLQPGHANAHYNMGLVLSAQGRLEEAMSHFGEALRLKPDFAAVHYDWGVVLHQSGRIAEAIEQYQQAVKLTPDDARAHFNLGMALASQGRHDEAVPHFEEALRINPDFIEACYNLGLSLTARERFDEAIRWYQKALELKPDDVEIREHLDALRSRKNGSNPKF